MRRQLAILSLAAATCALVTTAKPAGAAPAPHLTISTFAGSLTSGDALQVAQVPFGLATGSNDGSLVVADPVNHTVRVLWCGGGGSGGALAPARPHPARHTAPATRATAIPGSACPGGYLEDWWVGNGGFGTEGDNWNSAQLAGPYAVAAAGNDMYIADTFGNQIRHLHEQPSGVGAAPTPSVTTIAGTGELGFSGDGGAAKTAKLNSPYGIAVTHDQDIYVADTLNNRVRLIQPDGSITTVAGTGSGGYAGDGGPASSAQLNQPRGLALDCDGRLLIADTGNHAIRRLDPIAGTITTVAGTGKAGFGGDGAPATGAQLRQPAGVAVAPNCDVYVADTGNNRIRHVGNDGSIETAAGNGTAGSGGDGGPATSAQLSSPFAVAAIGNDDLAIGDTGSNTIREVYRGRITTIAGNGTASLSTQKTSNDELPQLAGPTSVAWNLGGGGGSVNACPTPPIGGSSSAVVTLDSFNHAVRAVCETVGGGANTVAPARPGVGGAAPTSTTVVDVLGNGRRGGALTGAALSTPMGMALGKTSDCADTVEPPTYVADTFNNRILEIDPTTPARISVIAGTGKAGFSGDGGAATGAQLSYPTGLAFAPGTDCPGSRPQVDDVLYIADTSNQRIRALDLTTGVITTVAGTGQIGSGGDGGKASQAELAFPLGIAIDTGRPPALYIADSFNNRIRRVDLASGVIKPVAGTGVPGFADGAAAGAEFDRPWGVTFNREWGPGESTLPVLYVADYLNHRVRRIDGGTVTTVTGIGTGGLLGDPGPAASAEVDTPRGVFSIDRQGSLLVADTFNGLVRQLGLASLQGGGTLSFPDTRTGDASASQTVRVTNSGNGYTKLTQVSTGSSAFQARSSCPTGELFPGQSCDIDVTFTPTTRGPATATLTVTDANGDTVSSSLEGKGIEPAVAFEDDTKSPATSITIHGSLPPAPTPTPVPTPTLSPCPPDNPGCHGFNTNPTGPAGAFVYVHNTGDAPLHVYGASISGGLDAGDCDPTSTVCDPQAPPCHAGPVPVQGRCLLMVTIPRDANPSVGTHQETLTITDDAAPDPSHVTHTIPVIYTIQPPPR
jgi:Abnormal spindle-like microcephaly-assoc'd, ASPM-SPD-2-Hydin/NHL repeat